MFIFRNLFLTFILMGLVMISVACHSDKPKHEESSNLIPRRLLFGNPEKTSPQLSPNGQQLAYIAPDTQNVLNIWVRDLSKPQEKDRMVTSDHKRGIRSFLWQFDNAHILYVQDKDGDENWHIYQTNIQTKKTKNLTPYEGAKADIVDYDYEHPDEMLVELNHRDKSLFDVYRLNLKTGQIELDTENFGDVFHWVADHDLKVRVAQSYTSDGSTLIQVRDTVNSPWRDFLTIAPDEMGGAVAGFSADNRFIYLISSLGANTSHLIKINLETKEQELIAEDPQYDLSSVMAHPTTHAIQAAGVERDRFEWILLDSKLTPDFDYLRQLCKGTFRVVSRDLSDKHWIVAALSDQRPACFYLYDRNAKKADFLFTTQPALERYTLSPMKAISYQARDGMKLFGYLTLPVDKEPHHLPTILLVHGGPWAQDTWGLQPSVQWLANRGYAVLQINFRGSTGYGKHYINAGNREWSGKMHTDLLDGKQWMIDQGYADPDKIAIYGGSYGGYATLVALTFTPDEFCCGIDVVGPSNLITLLETIPPYWAPLKAQMDIRLGSLEKDQDFLKTISPLYKADQIKRPLLIGQGANDPRVKQSESDQIVSAMRKKQLPVEYLLFPDEGHGFARPENRLKFFAAAEKFLTRYLGGRSEPASAEEKWESLTK
jgi:dipeptidyl aminopeptidase/acylaminoacyl peptidase